MASGLHHLVGVIKKKYNYTNFFLNKFIYIIKTKAVAFASSYIFI